MTEGTGPKITFAIVPEGYKFEANGVARIYSPHEALDPDIGFEQAVAREFGLGAGDVFKAIMVSGGLRPELTDEWAQAADQFVNIRRVRNEIQATLRIPPRELDSRGKYSRVSLIVYQHLHASGSFYHDPLRKESYWFNAQSKILLRTQSEDFKAHLSTTLQLNREDSAFKWTISTIEDRALRYAKRVEPKRLSHYDPTKQVLYFNHEPGRVLVLDGNSVTVHDNGDPVVFIWEEEWAPVDPDFAATGKLNELILRRLMLDPEESLVTNDEAAALNERWLLGILFGSILAERPLLGLIGEAGSGKTLFAELIGLLLFGPSFTPLGFEDAKEDGAIAYLTNSTYGVFDNADQPVRWLPDLLARACTGMSIPRRKLYTTNDLAKYPVDCYLAITARQTPWARIDIIDRLLLYKVRRPGKFISRAVLRASVLNNRPALIGELLQKANMAINSLKQEKCQEDESPFRLSAFYRFAVATVQGTERALVKSAFTKIASLQSQLHVEQEENLLTLLKNWLDNIGAEDLIADAKSVRWTRPLRVSEIYGRLANRARIDGFRFTVKSPLSLGHKLRELRATLRTSGILFKKDKDEKGVTWSFGTLAENFSDNPSEPSEPSAKAQVTLEKTISKNDGSYADPFNPSAILQHENTNETERLKDPNDPSDDFPKAGEPPNTPHPVEEAGQGYKAESSMENDKLGSTEKDLCVKCWTRNYQRRLKGAEKTGPPSTGDCEDCGEVSAFRVRIR
jgi:hypothetical protein